MNWKKAIILWLQNRVDVLEFHTVEVRSSNQSFRLPSVLLLRQYVRPHVSVKERPTRQQVFRRDRQVCQYCDIWFSVKDLTIDHVIPVSKGGSHSWENVVTCCGKCNNRKGDKSLAQMGYKLKVRPVKPRTLVGKGLNSAKDPVPIAWLPFFPDLDAS